MTSERKIIRRIRKRLEDHKVVVTVVLVLLVIITAVYVTQRLAIRDSLPPSTSSAQEYQIAKLAAEIQQIRSDTQGSLFSLKIIALFVTVGGAVGGYLAGQSHTTKKRLEFETLKNIDSVYQGLVLELADQNLLRRATAAVRLGTILKSFPSEWDVDDERKGQMIQRTKQILAASLAIEEDKRVAKALTIALALHRPIPKATFANVRGLDLSWANAADAYWARINFSNADFYQANLVGASFRSSVLRKAQFRNANLRRAVFTDADCRGANFNLADLRKAKLTNAKLRGARFEGARVSGCDLTGAKWGDGLADDPDALVNVSEADDGSVMIKVRDWLALQQKTNNPESSHRIQ